MKITMKRDCSKPELRFSDLVSGDVFVRNQSTSQRRLPIEARSVYMKLAHDPSYGNAVKLGGGGVGGTIGGRGGMRSEVPPHLAVIRLEAELLLTRED